MEVWAPHVDIEPVRAAAGAAVTDNNEGVTYRLQRVLGRGSYGSVWAANLITDAEDGEPRFAIKQFVFQATRQSIRQYESMVRREFFVSKLIASSDQGAFCGRYGICANKYFRVGPRVFPQMYIVFPFERVVSLDQFLQAFWTTWNADDPLPYQRTGLAIAADVMQSLGELHAFQIYHQDIKPDNLVVSQNERGEYLGVKFIDYGLSCINFGPESVLGVLGRSLGAQADTACDMGTGGTGAIFKCTPWFRDPRSGGAPDLFFEWFIENGMVYKPVAGNRGDTVFKREHVPLLWPKFDVFSAAVVIQTVFDPAQVRTRLVIARAEPPNSSALDAFTVYHSERMPGTVEAGLGKLLYPMTGPLQSRLSAAEYALQIRALSRVALSKKRKAKEPPALPSVGFQDDDSESSDDIFVNPDGKRRARGESPRRNP